MTKKNYYPLGKFSIQHPGLYIVIVGGGMISWCLAILALGNEWEILFSRQWWTVNLLLLLSLLPATLALWWLVWHLRKKAFWIYLITKSSQNKHPVVVITAIILLVPFLLFWQTLTIYHLTMDLLVGTKTIVGTCDVSREIKNRTKSGYFISEVVHISSNNTGTLDLKISKVMFSEIAARLTSPDTLKTYGPQQYVAYLCKTDKVTARYLPFTKRAVEVKSL